MTLKEAYENLNELTLNKYVKYGEILAEFLSNFDYSFFTDCKNGSKMEKICNGVKLTFILTSDDTQFIHNGLIGYGNLSNMLIENEITRIVVKKPSSNKKEKYNCNEKEEYMYGSIFDDDFAKKLSKKFKEKYFLYMKYRQKFFEGFVKEFKFSNIFDPIINIFFLGFRDDLDYKKRFYCFTIELFDRE